MKKNKWFIMAALFGLILSVSFLVTSCKLFEELLKGGCSGVNCSNADFSGCSSGIGSGCSSGMSGMNCSGLGSGMNCSGMSCK